MSHIVQPYHSFPPAAGGGLSTPTLLTTYKWASNASVHTTVSIAPSADTLIIVLGSQWAGAGVRTAVSVSSTFTTGGWTQYIDNAPAQSGDDSSTVVYWANFTSGSGTVTLTYSGNSPRGVLSVIEITGHDTVTPLTNPKEDAADSSPGTTASVTLDSTPATDSIVMGLITQRNETSMTVGSGFTVLVDDNSGGSAPCGQNVEYDDTTPGTTVDWSDLTDDNRTYCGFEIQAA